MVRRLILLLLLVSLSASFIYVLGRPNPITRWLVGDRVPPIAKVLDPSQGWFQNARNHSFKPDSLILSGLERPVTLIRDQRGVPHIFADNDRDAAIAIGYVTAQDRLFQLDFMPRIASGRLAEILGPDLVETDRFLRSTGMMWGAQKNWLRIQEEGGIELDLLSWFAEGVNAWMAEMDEGDLPFEFKLLDYQPEQFTPLHSILVMQMMAYDLTYSDQSSEYDRLRQLMNESEFNKLFPPYSRLYVPIVPGSDRRHGVNPLPITPQDGLLNVARDVQVPPSVHQLLARRIEQRAALQGTPYEGYIPGKGSNNWAVHGRRSTTNAPVLANDMHLGVNLPAIWYEVQIVTPTRNVYGVTIPGAPVVVVGFNDHVGWGFTNVGADLVDHYALELDGDGTRYRYNGAWLDLEAVPDTLSIRGSDARIDTLWYSRWGPVQKNADGALAIQWTAHKPFKNLQALWGMNQARDVNSFKEALRFWDVAPQNILYAGQDGHIAIRSTGHFPIRKGGHGIGILDGTTDAYEWEGRIPFEDLPQSQDPRQGFLTSTNQQPVGPGYGYYLGHDWYQSYRSLRIDQLLRSREKHSVEHIKSYQADVKAVQYDLFMPLLDTLKQVTGQQDSLRQLLRAWDGECTLDRPEPLVLDTFLDILADLVWDEFEHEGTRRPRQPQLYTLLVNEPQSEWLDIRSTQLMKETTPDLLRLALSATVDTLTVRYGWGTENWVWRDHHKIIFRHLTRAPGLTPLWRGPYPFPGFASTLSPAANRPTTHSASWRMVVDFSGKKPAGYGVYPGGQSGNPASPWYDAHLTTYLGFDYYPLYRPAEPSAFHQDHVYSHQQLKPGF